MRQRVFVAQRRFSRIVAIIFCAGFGLLGLVVGVSGVVAALRGLGWGPVFLAVLGLAIALYCGYGFYQLLYANAARIVLTNNGFEISGIFTPWTEVDGFGLVGSDDRAYVAVRYASDVRLDTRARISIALGKAGIHIPPAYIPTQFETGGHPLVGMLRDALWRSRNPQDEDDECDQDVVCEAEPPTAAAGSTTKHRIPLRRWAVARDILLSGFAVMFIAFLGPAIWLTRTPEPNPGVELVLGLVALILWLTLLAPVCALLWYSARRARIGGLRLDGLGFEFGDHRWAWADLESIEPAIRVIYRPDRITIPAPSSTGINPAYLDSGDEPLVDILRRWQAAHGSKPNADNRIRHVDDTEEPVGDELLIPINRSRVLSRSMYSFGVLAIILSGILSFWFTRGADFGGIALAVCIAIWSLLVIGAWMSARDGLRTLRARHLRLDVHGFTFGRHRWLWTDIEDVSVSREDDGEGGAILRIAVVHRSGDWATAPSRTPINPPDFDTGDRPLVDILRLWLQRYGAPAPISAEPSAPAEAPDAHSKTNRPSSAVER